MRSRQRRDSGVAQPSRAGTSSRHQFDEILTLQRLAGNRVVVDLIADGTAASALHRTPLQVSRLATTAASLGNTGLVGQVKALVGHSTYVKIKEELGKYYQAKPQTRTQHLNKMLVLIDKWMKANNWSPTGGNQARMQRLKVLQAEIHQELAPPAPLAPNAPWAKAAPKAGPQTWAMGAAKLPPLPATPMPPLPATPMPPLPATPSLTGVGKQAAMPTAPLAAPAAAILAPPIARPVPVVPVAPVSVIPPQAVALNMQLDALKAKIDKAIQVKVKVDLLGQADVVLQQLLPLLNDPALAKIKAAISAYELALRKALPALKEQADYMDDLAKEKNFRNDPSKAPGTFDYLSVMGLVAVEDAINLAKEVEKNDPAMSDQAKLMQQNGLTDAEMAALKIYTAPDYRYMNAALGNDPVWKQKALEAHVADPLPDVQPRNKNDADVGNASAQGLRHAKLTKKAMKKLPAWKSPPITYRGMGLSPADFKAMFEDKTTWDTAAFVSTSTQPTKALEFARREGRRAGVAILLHFDVSNGRDIDKLSMYPGEGEILLMPGATAKIVNVDKATPGLVKVHLKQST
jgi:hypothetical protein